jgi:hypothetical protein
MTLTSDPKLQALFEHNYSEALRISKRLYSSLQRLNTLFPLTVDFNNLSEEKIDSIDAFRIRFADLQDCIGNKLFRSLLTLEEEPSQSMLDTLHKMEKRQIIDNLKQWKQLRELRNIFSHDYPEAQEEKAEALNMAYTATPSLLAILKNIHSYTHAHIKLELQEPPYAPQP